MKIIALIKDSEKETLDQIHNSNLSESSLWKVPNVLFPIGAILLALLINLLFSENRFNHMTYFNIILNGSLPLIAINQISAIGLHLFKFEKGKEKKLGLNLDYLRTRLYYYCLIILIVGVLLFAFEVITNPFQSVLLSVVMICISSAFLYVSSKAAKNIFLLQENLIDNTFDKTIVKEGNETHGKDWE